MTALKDIETKLNETPDKQISLTNPDCRSMKTRGEGIVGYNVQTAVDTKHHLIVAHEVTNVGVDRDQLAKMAKQARAATDTENLTVVADRGYFKSEEILSCDRAGIIPIVPKTVTSSATAAGRFGKGHFIYNAKTNEYGCPAGQRLIWRFARIERGMMLHRHWSSSCQQCVLKAKCTPDKQRKVTRWEYEDVLDAMQARLDLAPDSMRLRRETVEHPYGTIKLWMGYNHFLMKTLKHTNTEMSLHVLAYNLKRVMKIMGIKGFIEAIRDWQSLDNNRTATVSAAS
jgi:transposase